MEINSGKLAADRKQASRDVQHLVEGANVMFLELDATTCGMGTGKGVSSGCAHEETFSGRKRRAVNNPFDNPSGVLLRKGPGSTRIRETGRLSNDENRNRQHLAL